MGELVHSNGYHELYRVVHSLLRLLSYVVKNTKASVVMLATGTVFLLPTTLRLPP